MYVKVKTGKGSDREFQIECEDDDGPFILVTINDAAGNSRGEYYVDDVDAFERAVIKAATEYRDRLSRRL